MLSFPVVNTQARLQTTHRSLRSSLVRVRPAPRLALGVAEAHAHASGANPVRVLRPARKARRQPLHAGNRGRVSGSGARPIVFPRLPHVLGDADTRGVALGQEVMTRGRALISGLADPGYGKLEVSLHTVSLQVKVTESRLRIFVAAHQPREPRHILQRRWRLRRAVVAGAGRHDDADDDVVSCAALSSPAA
jgi:hypothetical protein